MALAVHLVASTRHRDRSLCDPVKARWLWLHLQLAFPDAWSLVLMPDHLHLLAASGGLDRFRRVLAGFRRVHGIGFHLCDPQPAVSRAIVGRQIRYGFFNPVRAGLVDCPWQWRWSTLRDLGGAAEPRWTPIERVARGLGRSPASCLRILTRTADAETAPLATELPGAASVDDLIAAVGAALRLEPVDVLDARLGRRAVVQLAATSSQPPPTQLLAERLGMLPRSVRRLRQPRHPATDAAARCLADPRLRADLPFRTAFRSERGGQGR